MSFTFPDSNVTTEFTAANGITYSWDAIGGKWQIKRYAADLDDRYVNEEGGDTMEGPLIINGPRKAGDDADNPDLVSSLKVLSIDNAQNSSIQLRHGGNAKVYVGDTDVSIASDIKINRAAGSVVRTNVQDLLNISEREIAYLGQSLEDEDLVTKKYVDDADEELRQDIIELEEEIDAIAPASERGTWAFNPVGNVSLAGSYTMYTDFRDDGLGNVASIFGAVKNIALNERDLNNTVHNFGGTEDGDLLEIFEENDADYGLYSIVSIEKIDNPNPGGITYSYLSIDVKLERTGNGDMADSRARFKVFKAPSGGDASGFVMKSGDTMTGDLDIDRSTQSTNTEAGLTLKGNRNNINSSAATIAFENSQSSDIGYLTYRSFGGESFFKFNQNVDLNSKSLSGVGHIEIKPGGYIGAGSNQRLTFNNANSGTDGNGLLVVPRPANNRRGFAIRGNDVDGNEQDILYTFTNPTNTADAVNYVGKMDTDTNLVNKAYVDDRMAELLAKIEELEMTSGTPESYQFRMYNKTTGGSTEIGPQMFVNDIMSCRNDGDVWNGQDTSLLSSEYRHIYVCFEDGYRLNSTGQMSVVGYVNSDQYDARNSNVGTYNISGVEVCPPDKSSGKNIYRAVIQLDAYKPSSDAVYPSWPQGDLYITFSGGAVTKVS